MYLTGVDFSGAQTAKQGVRPLLVNSESMNFASRALLLLTTAPVLFGAATLFPLSAQATPRVGSPDTATAEPSVSRPTARPLKVALFQNLAFTDYTPKAYRYLPPPGGARRWAKVVLVADFSVTPGRQFDRTGQIVLGRTNLYFGTTMEPSRLVGPTWHVERDVTDDSALFRRPQPGEVVLGNIVNETYTGVIRGSAFLLFYPPDRSNPPAETPDRVLPLPNKAGGAAGLSGPDGTLTETFTFPTNVVRATLDLVTESQGQDEFWYLGVPTDLAGKLQTFGGTAFREAEVTVDGRPAGVAPVYPWIYTGGMDPSLWRPIPGVQTLSFTPYRVDLTPFAGVFSDGRPHRIGVHVFNGGSSFSTAGTLRLYCDPALKVVHGAVTADTLSAAPTPVIMQKIITDGDKTSGPVAVSSARRFILAGYVLTSHGRVETRIVQDVHFVSAQQFDLSPTRSVQNLQQRTDLSATTTTRTGSQVVVRRRALAYPLSILSTRISQPDKSASQAMTVRQGYQVTERVTRNGVPVFSSALSDEVTPSDTARFDAAGKFAGHQSKSAQTYSYSDSRGQRYQRTVKAVNGVVTGITP